MRYVVIGASLLATVAWTPAEAVAHKVHHGGKAGAVSVKSVQSVTAPDFGAIFSIMDKMFPPQPDPDPARLALARTAATAMWPEGTYGKMLSGMLGGMYDRAMQMKGSDFAALDNKSAKPAADSGATIHDTLASKDPYFDQRTAAIRAVLEEEATKLSAVIDPRMRDGLSRAMARKLDEQQLADLNTFLATPSGKAFAAQSMQLWVDPDAIRSMMSATPDMMKLLPEALQKIKEANDKFPEPKKEVPAPAKK